MVVSEKSIYRRNLSTLAFFTIPASVSILTYVPAYCYIVWGIHLRYVLKGEQDKYLMVWPNLWTLPEIVKAKDADSPRENGAKATPANGSAHHAKTNGHAANGQVRKRTQGTVKR